MLGLTLFISRSRLGRACRACAEDIKMANLLGINTNNIIALTFVIGAALAAIAAVLLSMQYGVINPNAGFLVGLKARSEEHTSELQSLMRNSYAVFCLKK